MHLLSCVPRRTYWQQRRRAVRGRIAIVIQGRNLAPHLHPLQVKTHTDVPADVTVHKPDPRVIDLPGEYHKARSREHGHVTAGWICGQESWAGGGICPGAGGKFIEVMA